jgi:UDP-N-acetylmuramoylalanine-D-glutamate ligase
MELNNKKVLVVGLGRTGVATASFLTKRGARSWRICPKGARNGNPAGAGSASIEDLQ